MGPPPLVLLAAALAGSTALAAEILWIRGLGRGTGTSPAALAVVAGLVLAGLGAGAAWGARRAAASARPARPCALALLAAGTLVALSPLYLEWLPDLHTGLLNGLGLESGGGPWPVLALAAPLVLPAAFLLGFAFPLLVRARVGDLGGAAARTGGVYALNTLGSVAGLAAALLLLPAAGETQALRLTGVVALVAALLLLLGDRRLPHGHELPPEATPRQRRPARGMGWVLFASGAGALMAQMGWFRMLQPLAGEHLWGVALLLAPILLGTALGAGLAGPIADRTRRPERLLAATLVLAGVLTLLSLPAAGLLPRWLLAPAGEGAARAVSLVLGYLAACGPASVAFGAALPLAVRARADAGLGASAPAGRLYAQNAMGAVAGSVVAGFVLLPALGAERGLLLAAAVPVVAGSALCLANGTRRRFGVALLHLAPLAVLLWPGLVPTLLAAGPDGIEIIAARRPLPPGLVLRDREDVALYTALFAGQPARAPGRMGPPLPAFEGRAGRVTLIEEPDGHVGLRRGADRESVFDPDRPDVPSRTEFLLGLLPGLLHPQAERALVIGHGAGWTAEAGLATGVRHLDVAELDDAVLDAARAYRGLAQLPVEASDRARVLRADGRVLLRRAVDHYDWIASQPSQPWNAGAAHLFTQEAYQDGHDALRAEGIFAQWLTTYDLSPGLLRRALGAFRSVFSDVWVFRSPGELILLGFRSRPRVLPGRWERLLHRRGPCAEMAQAAGLRNAGEVWRHFVLDTAGVDRVLGTDPGTVRDDRPDLALDLAWRLLTLAAPREGESILMSGFPPDMEAILPNLHERERWLAHAVRGWLREDYPIEADLWAQRIRWGVSAEGAAAQGSAALANGRFDRAESLFGRAIALQPQRADLVAEWIDAVAAAGRSRTGFPSRLAKVEAIVERFPDDGVVLAAVARAHRHLGTEADARAWFERAVAAKGADAPPGARIALARLVLSSASGPPEEKRAMALLANDPETYDDVDALDLMVRLASQAGEETQASTYEKALESLQQTRGLAALRHAAGNLARHELDDALDASRRSREAWASQPAVWEISALAGLVAHGADRESGRAPRIGLSEIAETFRKAIERSDDPEAARARALRMLGWYGHDASLLDEGAIDMGDR